MLEKYTIVGIVHSHGTPGGTFTFDDIATPPATAGGKRLGLVARDDLPPAVNAYVTLVTGVFSQGFGSFGKGYHWFVYDSDGFDVCALGELAIPAEGEVYTYKTPLPGCPSF